MLMDQAGLYMIIRNQQEARNFSRYLLPGKEKRLVENNSTAIFVKGTNTHLQKMGIMF